LRLAFVVQRYGLDISGGAEYHCRLVTEHLARHVRVEVLTTRAADYISWANHYQEGTEELNGVTVRRFGVKRTRDPYRFRDWSEKVARSSHTDADELRWLEEEGPFSPDLVQYVKTHRDDHDVFVLFSYRYYTTYHALPHVASKALVVPTAEDDGIYRLGIFPPWFRRPAAIAYNSPEERRMIVSAAANDDVPGEVVGVGSALPQRLDGAGFRRRYGIDGRFVLYVGRVDRNKGCGQLFDHFLRYRRETGSALRLVLIGQPVLEIPHDPAIVPLGFLPDPDKWDALAAAELLLMPSFFESLSMVTLEAWWAEKPVLANAKCEVLLGQCRRANAGLYYSTYDEFREALLMLERDEGLRGTLGRNGRRYYDANYSWPVIETKYLDLLSIIAGGSRRAIASGASAERASR
jgi:glycosyltransferase involved in cell wall biosynthesis